LEQIKRRLVSVNKIGRNNEEIINTNNCNFI
jgi:hypothetical protein